MFVMEYWKQFSPIGQGWHTFIAFVYTFIAGFAFIANLMVIYYLTRVKKKGRQDGSYFLINLAVVDALKAVFGLPLVVISSFYGKWVFGKIGCSYYGFTGGVFGFASLATLSLMSIERFLIVSNPLRIFSKKFKTMCLLATWGYALIWSLLQFGSEHGYVLEGFLTSCSFDYFSRDNYTRMFMTAMIVGGFLIPLFTLVIFLWLTKRALESKTKEFGGNQSFVFSTKSKSFSKTKTSSVGESSDSGSEGVKVVPESEESSATNLKKREKNLTQTSVDFENKEFSFKKRQYRVLKTIFMNIIFFCIAWTPYAIIVCLAQYGSNIEEYINPYTTSLPALLSKTSSIYNPILYTLNNQDCKNYFKRALFH